MEFKTFLAFLMIKFEGVMAEGSPRLGGGQVLTKTKARNRLLVSCTISPLFTVLKLKNKSYFYPKSSSYQPGGDPPVLALCSSQTILTRTLIC